MIIILEDEESRKEIFLKKYPNAFITNNPNLFITTLKENQSKIEIMFLDHDISWYESLMYGSREVTGLHVVKKIVELKIGKNIPQIIIHSLNTTRSILMEQELCENGYKNIQRIPFVQLISFLKKQ